jgi:PAS domain S-box-containing protein
MPNTQQPRPPPDPATLPVIVVSVVLAGLLILIMALVLNVRSLLLNAERSNFDRGQWVTVQTEVEVLRLRHALATARNQPGPTAQAEIRRWFSVLYGRISILSESPLYASLLQQPANDAELRRLQTFADTWLAVVEGPDPALVAALPQLEVAAAALQRATRALALAALKDFAAGTDRARGALSLVLARLAVTTAATLLTLVLLAVLLLRVSDAARQRAREYRITGERLQMIIATSADAIVVTNRGGRIVEFNAAAEVMFGISRAQALGREATKAIFAPEDRAAYQAVITDAVGKAVTIGPQRLELEGLHLSGKRFPMELSIAIRDLTRDGLIVAFLRDISTRRAAGAMVQDALQKARAGEQTKARFIAVMSHEMRTPLNGLLGSMGLMRDTGLDADQAELLRVMLVSGEVLLGHVNSVLDVTLAEAGLVKPAVAPFDLDSVLDDCVASQAGVARKAETSLVHVPLTGAFGSVLGDAGRVRQVLLNLIGNAVKFTPKGSVTVESERLPPGLGASDAPWVEVRVIDTGIGIAPQDQARVFQDFERAGGNPDRASGGTGLGLGIARRLVEAMGGEIGVESGLGTGSVFWVRLLLGAADQTGNDNTAALDKPPPSAHDAPPLSVLIVEDNDINRFVLRRYLEAAGHTVAEAVDGHDAVTQAGAQAFDLIVTDIAMPRLDGIEAARLIREGGGASADARIIVLTAHAMPSDQGRLDAVGIDACLTKPVSRAVLLEAALGPLTCAPPVPAEPLAPLVDKTPLTEMAATLGPGPLGRLLSRMVDEGDSTLAHLATSKAAAHSLHQLGGGCAMFGAERMRLALAHAEQMIASGENPSAALAVLPPLWHDTRAALLAHMRETATNP